MVWAMTANQKDVPLKQSALPTGEERRAMGQARRKQVKRQQHALWDVKLRKNDPLQLLAESMNGRVPELVPIKYERMLASPFGFFRGAVPVMASDLSLVRNTGILNQICGDAHAVSYTHLDVYKRQAHTSVHGGRIRVTMYA